MSTISRDEIRTLLNTRADYCVSLSIPTDQRGIASTQQNPIRFKNALRQAGDRLLAGGLRPLEARTMLEPAAHLLQHADFWRYQSDGLALFLASDTSQCRYYRLPLAFDELVVVTNRLHLKPLLNVYKWLADIFTTLDHLTEEPYGPTLALMAAPEHRTPALRGA